MSGGTRFQDLRIAALDFEASRLPGPGSVPIEVGVARADGLRASWLIDPARSWPQGHRWDPAAEAVHGIGRAELAARGMPARQAAAELLAAVDGWRILVGHGADLYWLEALARAAGRPAPRLAP